jgi:hypothetical protein
MPHAEIKYSSDLTLPVEQIFAAIENTIHALDDGAGECKCRAYKSDQHKYPHILISLSLLAKPHRDQDFSDRLMARVEAAVKALIAQSCYFSLALEYNSANYITAPHIVPGDHLARYGETAD